MQPAVYALCRSEKWLLKPTSALQQTLGKWEKMYSDDPFCVYILKKKTKKRQQHLRRKLLSKTSSSQRTGTQVWISLLSATSDPIPTQQHISFFSFSFFKKAYEQFVEEHFSPQRMFRPAVLAQCLTLGPHAELFGGLHAVMPHQVCLMASDVVHFPKKTKQKTLHAVLQDGAKDVTVRLVMLGSVVCCRLLTPSSCLSIFFNDVKAAGSILYIQCKHKILLQSESSRWKSLTQVTQYLYYLWATNHKPTYIFHRITFIYLQLKMAKFLEDDNLVTTFI